MMATGIVSTVDTDQVAAELVDELLDFAGQTPEALAAIERVVERSVYLGARWRRNHERQWWELPDGSHHVTDEVVRTYGRQHVERVILRRLGLPPLPERAWEVLSG